MNPQSSAKASAYVVVDGHRNADFAPHVFFTEDFGHTWHPISGFPANLGVVRVLREDPVNPNLLFAGTEFGAYLSQDRGAHWSLLSGKLPTVRIDDIKIHPREHDLILATHGRSLWVLDDLTPLESPEKSTTAAGVTLFDSRPAISYRQIEVHAAMDADKTLRRRQSPLRRPLSPTASPPNPRTHQSFRIFDAQHALIQQFAGTADGRPQPRRLGSSLPHPGQGHAGAAVGRRHRLLLQNPSMGPVVLPGDYTVELSLGLGASAATLTRPIHVEDDPNVTLSTADRASRQAVILRGFEMYKLGHAADLRYSGPQESSHRPVRSPQGPTRPHSSPGLHRHLRQAR